MTRGPEDIPTLVARVMQHATGEARGWMLELAGVLNRTVPCPRCEGRGWHEKCRRCRHSCHEEYCYGCRDPVECRMCKGHARLLKPNPGPAPAERTDDR